MKKLILTLVAVVCFAGINEAQEKTDLREDLLFGFKVGLNLSNVYDEQGQDFVADSKIGFATGAFLAIPIGKYFGLQPELLLSQRGFQSTGSILGSNYSLKRTSSWIDVPILFALKPSEFITLLAGPQYSYLTKQKDVFENGVTTVAQENEFRNDNIRKNILCFTGGVDITLKHLVIGARAGWDLQRNNSDGTTSTPRYKNRWIQGTIGYRLF